MDFFSKLNVAQNKMSQKMLCHSKWSTTQDGVPVKMECHSKLNEPQNVMSPKWNIAQI